MPAGHIVRELRLVRELYLCPTYSAMTRCGEIVALRKEIYKPHISRDKHSGQMALVTYWARTSRTESIYIHHILKSLCCIYPGIIISTRWCLLLSDDELGAPYLLKCLLYTGGNNYTRLAVTICLLSQFSYY